MGYEGDGGYHGPYTTTKSELEAAVRKYAKARVAENELWAMLGYDGDDTVASEDKIVAVTMAGLKTSSALGTVTTLSVYWNGEDD